MPSACRSTGTHLILDQRQQWANDKRAASRKQGWQLVAQTLAASRGHQTQHVTALHGRIDYLTLLRPVNMASQHMLRHELIAVQGVRTAENKAT